MRKALLVLVLLAAAWAAERAAVLTDVVGPVFVVGPAGTSPASLLRVLAPGDRLELRAGARVALTTFADGHTDVARGPCRLEIGTARTRLTEGPAGALQSLPPGRTRALVPKGENLERLGGSIVSCLQQTASVPPLMSRAGVRFSAQERFSSPPRFRLETLSPARLTLLDESGSEIWSGRTTGNEVAGPKLPAGRYTLLAVDEEAFESELAFEVMGSAEAAAVTLARQEAAASLKSRPGELSPRLLLIGVYLEHGLLGEALDEAQTAERERPGQPQLRALVRSLEKQLWPLPDLP